MNLVAAVQVLVMLLTMLKEVTVLKLLLKVPAW